MANSMYHVVGLYHIVRYLGASLALVCLLVMPAAAQLILYNNGPDAGIGYSHINFGAATSDSFTLSRAATLTSVTFAVYTVDDGNPPERAKWTITTEPFADHNLATGVALLGLLNGPYITQFGFFGWEMKFDLPNVNLPAGSYWLQLQDVTTRWDTWSFWAESNGPATAYHLEVGASGYGTVTPVTSDSFAVEGSWMTRSQQNLRRR
ncbi:MAG TPA: hypothetical protein VL240_12400 [Candidatus Binatia bacterium]|nr:hypothetical protein [Candidatus Binatia bacterium]